MPKKVGRMKVLADGELNKPLIVKAEDYSVQAIKMIELTGGTVIILKD
jgi:ribosomal protein L15